MHLVIRINPLDRATYFDLSVTGGENSSGPEEIVTVLLAAVVFEVGFDSTEILLG